MVPGLAHHKEPELAATQVCLRPCEMSPLGLFQPRLLQVSHLCPLTWAGLSEGVFLDE